MPVAPLAVIALAGSIALAGCQSEEAPATPAPTTAGTSVSVTPTASPSPSASGLGDVPAAALEKTEEGAEAFVRYFMREAARAWTTPDPELIERHATADCGACADLADVARALKADGQRYDAAPISVEKLTLLRQGSGEFAFDAELVENKVNVVTESGDVVDSYPRRPITRAIAVTWGVGQWRVDGIGE